MRLRADLLVQMDEVILALIGWMHHSQHRDRESEASEAGMPEGDMKRLARLLESAPHSLSRLVLALERAQVDRRSHEWNWDGWLLEGAEELTAHWVDFDQHLDWAFVLVALRSDMSVIELENWVPSRDFAFKVREGWLLGIAAQLDGAAERSLLPEDWKKRVDQLGDMLKVIAARREESDKTREQVVPLEEERLESFKLEALKVFSAGLVTREMFARVGLLDTYNVAANPRVARLAVSRLMGRAAFFSEHIGIMHIDRGDMVRGLAHGVDGHVFGEIAKREQSRIVVAYEKALQSLKGIAEELQSRGGTALAIISADYLGVDAYSWHQPIFEAAEARRNQGPGPIGFLKLDSGLRVPIYIVHHPPLDKVSCVVDMNTIGRLKFAEWANGEREGHDDVRDVLYFMIRDMAEDGEMRRKFLESPPGWLVELKDEDPEAFLRRHVYVQVSAKVEYVCPEGAVVASVVSSDAETDELH